MLSLSLRISCKFFVPKMFLRVVWAKSLDKYFFVAVGGAMLQHRVKHVFDVLPGRVMGIFHVGHTDLIIHQDILFGNPKILLLFKVENLHSPSHWKLCRGKNGKFRMFCIFGSIIVFWAIATHVLKRDCKTYDDIYYTCNRQQRQLTQ